MEEFELTPEEKKAFEALADQQPPSAFLEEKIVNALKDEGLIKKQVTMNQFVKYTVAVAASVLLFLAGTFTAKQSGTVVEIDPMKGYMMILKEDQGFRPGDPMEMFNEYAAWMNATGERGVKITGQELQNEAWRLSADGTTNLNNQEVRTTGYFIIEAATAEEALAVAQDNPHLKYGGTIELKAYMNR